ncbi:MAG: hypothetical protein HOC09_05755 [Deltaproteobacteria bacterium]|nr:hypothetical protein [Deltaproteobacteria bacterium]
MAVKKVKTYYEGLTPEEYETAKSATDVMPKPNCSKTFDIHLPGSLIFFTNYPLEETLTEGVYSVARGAPSLGIQPNGSTTKPGRCGR